MKNPVVFSILCLVIFTFTFSCNQKKSEWKGTIEEKDGVVIVNNPDKPMYEEDIVSIRLDLYIGGTTMQKDYVFNRISGFDVDIEGNIFILDSLSANIIVFNEEGKFLRAFGRMGQGPGEMQRPGFIQLTKDRELIIGDYPTRRLIFFTPSGSFLRQISLAKIGYPAMPERIDSDGNFYATLVHPPVREGPGFVKFNLDLDILQIITTHKISNAVENRKYKVMLPEDRYFVSSNDHVVLGNTKEYVLKIINPEGDIIRIINKDHKPIKLNEKDRKIWGERTAGLSLAKMGYEIILPDFFPAYRNFSMDDLGRIFVETYKRYEEQEKSFFTYDVFDPEGKYITKIPIRSRPLFLLWKKEKLYTLELDDNGYRSIKRYIVTWNQ